MPKNNQEIEAQAETAKAKKTRNVYVTFSEETVERTVRVPASMTVKTDAGETVIQLGTAPDGTLNFAVAHGAKARAGDAFASVSKEVADGGNRGEVLARIAGEVADDFNSGDFTIKRGGGGGGLTRQAFAMTYLGNAYAAKGQALTQAQLKDKAKEFLALPDGAGAEPIDARLERFNAAYEAAKAAGADIDIDI